MKPKLNREKVIAASVTFLLFASLIGLLVYQSSNKSLKEILNSTKLKSETLLSEKLNLDKEILRLKRTMADMAGKSTEIDRLLVEANEKLSQKETEIKTYKKENQKVKSLQNQLAAIQKIKSDLEEQIASLNMNNNQLANYNEELNRSIASLQNENKTLKENMAILSTLVADNFRVESIKGNKDRLTVNARKAKKLVVGFDVPPSIAEDVSFKITTPKGELFTSKDDRITSTIIEDERSLLASMSPLTGQFEISKRIEMVYKPEKKLSSGIYKIDIYNKDTKLSSCQIRLR